jgi:hypothetical protein
VKKNKKTLTTFLLMFGTIAIGVVWWTNSNQKPELVSVNQWNQKVSAIEQENSKSDFQPEQARSIASVKNDQFLPKVSAINAKLKQDKSVLSKHRLAPAAGYRYKSLQPAKKSDFVSNEARYKFLDHFYAVANTPENRQLYPRAEMKLNYLIVESEAPLHGLLIVENEETGNLGIFTGVLKVKLNSLQDMETLINHNQYQIINIYDHIQVVQYQIDDVELAIKTYQQLRQNSQVQRVNLEILEYARTHR